MSSFNSHLIDEYTSEDDTAFREASGVLKLFALGAHQVCIYVLYVPLLESQPWVVVPTSFTPVE